MILNNLIFFFCLTIISVLFNKYSIITLKKYSSKLLIDDQFKKPQAFHEQATPICGGIGLFFSFIVIYIYLFLFLELTYLEHLLFCTAFFFLGLSDDLKYYLRPKIRLGIMIFFLIFLIQYNNFYIENTGIGFLNYLVNNYNLFSLFFVCLCFLFIINGANLIDGYNGLLGIHSLIIIINLFLINYFNKNDELAILLFSAIIVLLIFIKFNFPSGKIFLGDSGSYFLGSFIAVSTIQTSFSNPTISPFYFCVILYYLFFEVFFSFIRKLISKGKHPLIPDKKHLHMLIYKILFKKNNLKLKSNYQVSIIINTAYLILTIPGILFMNNGMFCKYYAVFLIISYLLVYKFVHKKSEI